MKKFLLATFVMALFLSCGGMANAMDQSVPAISHHHGGHGGCGPCAPYPGPWR